MQWLTDTLLTFIIAIPALGAAVIAFMGKERVPAIRNTAMITSLIVFALSAVLFILYDEAASGFQFAYSASWIGALGVSYHVAVDGISVLLIALTALIVPLALQFSCNDAHDRVKGYMIAVLALESGILGVFCARDMLLFYMFWEIMLIPLYFLIGLWGGEDRIRATVRFFIYTIAGSLLMLAAILYMYFQTPPVMTGETVISPHSFGIDAFETAVFPWPVQIWLFMAFTLAFFIKAPVFPFHTWQPLAYVQAPTAVTVLLAALLAKTAVYGLLRFSVPFFSVVVSAWSPYLMGIAAFSAVFGALVAITRKQMKPLIAYASMSHMGMMALGVFALTSQSWQGSVIQMISHGITAAGLFFMIGFLFDRKPAHDIDAFGGLWKPVPVISALFLVFSLSMIGMPGTNGFIGEFLILVGTFKSSFAVSAVWTVIVMISVIFSAVYMLGMVQRMMMGPLSDPDLSRIPDLRKRESLILIPLILFIFWIGLYPKTFTQKTEKSIEAVLIKAHKNINDYQSGNKSQKIKIRQAPKF